MCYMYLRWYMYQNQTTDKLYIGFMVDLKFITQTRLFRAYSHSSLCSNHLWFKLTYLITFTTIYNTERPQSILP